MGIFKNFFLRRKASAAGHLLVNQPFREHTPNRNYKSLSEEGYRKNVIAKRCIDYIAASVADISVDLFSKRKDIEITDHPLLTLLDNPNPTQCYEEYMQSLVSYYMLHGNTFSEAVFGTKSMTNPQELWIQRPDMMKVVPGAKALPVAYTLSNQGKKYVWSVDVFNGNSPIMHVKTFNPLDIWYGMSFLESAAFSVDQFNQSMVWNISLLKNAARPSGAFVLEKGNDPNFQGLTEEQRSQVRSEITDIYTGSGNTGRPMLLEGGLKFIEMGLSPKDMDWIQSKNTSSRDICLAFGVPPQLVGITGDSTYANYEQARLAFYDSVAIPLARLMSKALTRWLTPMYKGGELLELRIDIDSIEALAPRRAAKWGMVSTSNFLTTNEKRIETGFGRYEPSDDPADQIFVNAGLIPIDFASDFSEEPLEDTEDVTGKDPKQDDEEEVSDEEEGKSEVKSFNLSSERKKRQFWVQQTRKAKRNEIKMRNKVMAAFIKEGRKMASELEGTDPMVWELLVDEVLEDNKKFMFTAIGTSVADIASDFGKQVFDQGKSLTDGVETKQKEERFERFLKSYITTFTAESVASISNTTRKRLKSMFKRLSKEDVALGEVAIGKEIRKLYKGFTPARSKTIARTETHNAAMTSQLKAADSLGIPNLKKEWVSSQDEHSRDGENGPDHLGMNGTKVENNDKFEVTGSNGTDLMEGPGDPTAPAEQIINCRCVLAFSTEE